MKTKFIFALALLCLSSTAFAQNFPISAQLDGYFDGEFTYDKQTRTSDEYNLTRAGVTTSIKLKTNSLDSEALQLSATGNRITLGSIDFQTSNDSPPNNYAIQFSLNINGVLVNGGYTKFLSYKGISALSLPIDPVIVPFDRSSNLVIKFDRGLIFNTTGIIPITATVSLQPIRTLGGIRKGK